MLKSLWKPLIMTFTSRPYKLPCQLARKPIFLQLFGTWTSQYAERLAPAPDTVMTVAAAKDTFYGAPIGGFIVDGTLYGLPQEFNLEYGGVLVNKTKFDAAGVAFPPAWTDRTALLTDAQELAEVDDTRYHDGCWLSFYMQ